MFVAQWNTQVAAGKEVAFVLWAFFILSRAILRSFSWSCTEKSSNSLLSYEGSVSNVSLLCWRLSEVFSCENFNAVELFERVLHKNTD